jgi:hypothetical protein
VLVIARLVNAVATKHENNGSRGCEHIFPTDWTIAIRHPFYAFVGAFHGHRHTYTTSLFLLLAKDSTVYMGVGKPCNEKSLSQGHGLFYICHNHSSDICFCSSHCPTTYRHRSNTMLFFPRTGCRILRLVAQSHKSYRACFSWPVE